MRHIRSYLSSRVLATVAAVALLGGGAAIADVGSDSRTEQGTGTPVGTDEDTGPVTAEDTEAVTTEVTGEVDEDADTEDPGPPDHAPARGFRAQQGEEAPLPPGLRDTPPSDADDPERDGPPEHAPAHGRGNGEDPDAPPSNAAHEGRDGPPNHARARGRNNGDGTED